MKHVRRTFERFLAHPSSLRYATTTIIAVTVAMVLVGAVAIRVFDRQEYPTFGSALWFTLQTVTTVGYGDNTPARPIGRFVAAAVMLTAIGLITVVTAVVTSLFMQAAEKRVGEADRVDQASVMARLEASLTSISERLDRIEAALDHTVAEDADSGH
jgi:voltage-gated potassium channel